MNNIAHYFISTYSRPLWPYTVVVVNTGCCGGICLQRKGINYNVMMSELNHRMHYNSTTGIKWKILKELLSM